MTAHPRFYPKEWRINLELLADVQTYKEVHGPVHPFRIKRQLARVRHFVYSVLPPDPEPATERDREEAADARN